MIGLVPSGLHYS